MHTLCSGYFIQVAIHQHMDLYRLKPRPYYWAQKFVDALNFHVANIFADCQVLASDVKARSYRQYPGHWSLYPAHWSLRATMADIEAIIRSRQFSAINISRDKNKTANKLAKMTRQASIPNSCLYFCDTWVHHP